MEPLLILGLIFFGILAGVLGTMFGLGGGIILVPVLTIIYGLSATEAAAVSLVGIIAASAGGASAGIRERSANIKLGMLLEIPTAMGAVIGAFVAIYIDDIWLMLLFAAIITYSGIRMIMNKERVISEEKEKGDYDFTYYDNKKGEIVSYTVQNVSKGSAACGFAGAIASMTGVGGGMIKVPLMNLYMGVPMKAAAPTSSYMIGITAFSGAVVYFIGGEIILAYAASVAIGGFIGSLLGFEISKHFNGKSLRKYFAILAFAMAASVLLQVGGVL